MIADYLYIACESGYYEKADWQDWADHQILTKSQVEYWIYDVSLAKDIVELGTAVCEKRIEERYYEENNFSPSDATVGYYYLQFIDNRLSLRNIIDKLSNEDDPATGSSIHYGVNFYDIWKKVYADEKQLDNPLFIHKITGLCEPYQHIALKQLEQLELYSYA
ncbi:hypothetical protein [Paenibacillus sp. DCT19]|uniref:hypothetical protein n=1 Tax=Paenibacillus sp. DCT19 TaxID=2211212 RepID=UPI000FE1DFC9|nr:hypothetical protein [Paenibacillus sp. DCT19]